MLIITTVRSLSSIKMTRAISLQIRNQMLHKNDRNNAGVVGLFWGVVGCCGVLWGCCGVVVGVLCGCCGGVAGCCRGVVGVLWGCCGGVVRMLWGFCGGVVIEFLFFLRYCLKFTTLTQLSKTTHNTVSRVYLLEKRILQLFCYF